MTSKQKIVLSKTGIEEICISTEVEIVSPVPTKIESILDWIDKDVIDIAKPTVIEISRKTYDARLNVMYLGQEIELNINVVSSIDTILTETFPDMYPSLLRHLAELSINQDKTNEMISDLYRIGVKPNNNLGIINVIEIKLNTRLIGYYIPEINSWIMGNICWHKHYVSVVLKNIWPQIITQLNMLGY
jgi:hypothetical protein